LAAAGSGSGTCCGPPCARAAPTHVMAQTPIHMRESGTYAPACCAPRRDEPPEYGHDAAAAAAARRSRQGARPRAQGPSVPGGMVPCMGGSPGLGRAPHAHALLDVGRRHLVAQAHHELRASPAAQARGMTPLASGARCGCGAVPGACCSGGQAARRSARRRGTHLGQSNQVAAALAQRCSRATGYGAPWRSA